MSMDFNYDYLLKAVDALLYGVQLPKDQAGRPWINATQPYLFPLPTVFPAIVAYPGGGPLVRVTDGGYPLDQLVFTVNLRLVAGKLSDGFKGEVQTRLWLFEPLIINWINRHPHLRFDNTQTFIPELHPDGARCFTVGRFGRFADETDHIGMEFGVEIPFTVSNPIRLFGG